jgi:hypothetical protein
MVVVVIQLLAPVTVFLQLLLLVCRTRWLRLHHYPNNHVDSLNPTTTIQANKATADHCSSNGTVAESSTTHFAMMNAKRQPCHMANSFKQKAGTVLFLSHSIFLEEFADEMRMPAHST